MKINWKATDMESGDLDIRSILNQFPEDIPCAIEYPCGEQNQITQKLEHDKNELQSWVPVRAISDRLQHN